MKYLFYLMMALLCWCKPLQAVDFYSYSDESIRKKFGMDIPLDKSFDYYRENCSVLATPNPMDCEDIVSALKLELLLISPLYFGCIELSPSYMLLMDVNAFYLPPYIGTMRFTNSFICPRFLAHDSACLASRSHVCIRYNGIFNEGYALWKGALVKDCRQNPQNFEHNTAALAYRNFVEDLLPMLMQAKLEPQQNIKLLKREINRMLQYECEDNYLFVAKMLCRIEDSDLVGVEHLLPLDKRKKSLALSMLDEYFKSFPHKWRGIPDKDAPFDETAPPEEKPENHAERSNMADTIWKAILIYREEKWLESRSDYKKIKFPYSKPIKRD